MKNLIYTFFAISILTPQIQAQIPEFELIEMGDADSQLGQGELIDLDNDGDLDWIMGSQELPMWFEYLGNDQWKKHIISYTTFTENGAATLDVDQDGDLDLASGNGWYENTGDPTHEFTYHENKAIISYDNEAADIDGDGMDELIALSYLEGLYWYDIREGKEDKRWKEKKIADGVRGGISPDGIGDIDCDDDLDIVRAHVWYENTDGDASNWKPHRTITGFGRKNVENLNQNSMRTILHDMDGDGDLDIVQSEANTINGRVAWHENKDCEGINFFTHWISSSEGSGQDCHSLCLADFDNDGDMDVFSGGGPKVESYNQKLFIWENTGKESIWEKHVLFERKESFEAVCGDVDADGDIDICFKSWKGDKVYFLKNKLID
ncbi:MAG: hypothetical protein GVY19_04635 [Bacteroidetes bacterium]|jgi:hypothetical protein|nr:hypothetical protein [Bacteroidota bacterium]